MKKNILFVAVMIVSVIAQAQSCPDNNHPHAIDLGLPSRAKWSCCNVDANKPEEYGTYYAFGETKEREIYSAKCYVNERYADKQIVSSDDVATVKWGKLWHIPSLDDIGELINNCTSEWTVVNGVNGRMFTGKNDNKVFLPAGGKMNILSNESLGKLGHYWSNTEYWDDRANAFYFYFHDGNAGVHFGGKAQGLLIRPVKK